MNTNATSRGITTVVYLIAIQVISRGLTFVGNQALLRYVSPQHLGLAVQLEALSISVLYTSRESLRVALQRYPRHRPATQAKTQDVRLQGAVNGSFGVVILGFLIGSLLGTSYLYSTGLETSNATNFKTAFWLYAAATVIELLSEPGFVVIQQNDLFNVRARAETTAAIVRCIAACSAALALRRLEQPMSVLPFAIGQICYGASLFIVYQWSALNLTSQARFSMYPSKLESATDTMLSLFPKSLLALAGAFYGQSIFKWLLTQGDTLVLSIFADFEAQGVFALASNYGGLASRLLFQPVEESSRNVFGSLLSNEQTPQKAARSPLSPRRQQAVTYLSTILRMYILLVLMPCVAILPRCFPLLVSLLLGSKSQWNSSETVALLQAYSYYIPALAINGVLDAFVTSVATEVELGAQSVMMLGVTMIYLSAAYFGMTTLRLGAVGLVYANILNMFLRTIFSMWFIRGWIQPNLPQTAGEHTSAWTKFAKRALPTTSCLLSFMLVVLGMYGEDYVKISLKDQPTVAELSKVKLGSIGLDLFDLSYLFSAAVVLISSIVLTEHDFLLDTIEPLLPQKMRTVIEPYTHRNRGAKA